MAGGRPPPRFVPTLTEVVQGGAREAAQAPAPITEQVVSRVLQRVDVVLDRRLREAIGAIVLEQTTALVPMLRERLDEVVREVVVEALADELQSRQRAGD